jgi:hypothetical protein
MNLTHDIIINYLGYLKDLLIVWVIFQVVTQIFHGILIISVTALILRYWKPLIDRVCEAWVKRKGVTNEVGCVGGACDFGGDQYNGN